MAASEGDHVAALDLAQAGRLDADSHGDLPQGITPVVPADPFTPVAAADVLMSGRFRPMYYQPPPDRALHNRRKNMPMPTDAPSKSDSGISPPI